MSLSVICPTCPNDCTANTNPELVDLTCAASIVPENEEISGLIFTTEFDSSGDPVGMPSDPTSAVSLSGAISNTGTGKFRYVIGIGSLSEETGAEVVLNADFKKSGIKTYTLNISVPLPGNNPMLREGLRKLCGGKVAFYYHTAKKSGVAGIYGQDIDVSSPTNTDGKPLVATYSDIQLGHATGDGILRANIVLKWDSRCAPARLGLYPL